MANTNPIAGRVASHMQTAQAKFAQSLSRLSYGTRMAAGGGHAADISMGSRLKSQFQASLRRTGDLQRLLTIYQVADDGLSNVQEMMQRMQEIALRTADGSQDSSSKKALEIEFNAIRKEVFSTLENTRFDGKSLLNPQPLVYLDATDFRLVAGDAVSPSSEDLPINMSSTASDSVGGSLAFLGDGSATTQPDNLQPTGKSDSYTVNEDGTLSVDSLLGVLSNDTDIDGDGMTATLIEDVSNGTLTLNGDGSFTYTPTGDFYGTDTFKYRASDGTTSSDVTTVTLNIQAVEDAPIAQNDSAYTIEQDQPLEIPVSNGVLANDSDGEGATLTASLVTGPSNGSLTFNSDGSFDYTPSAGYSGTDSFTYQASDGALTSNTATVTITIDNVGLPPGSRVYFDFTDENGDFAGHGNTQVDLDGTNYLEGPPSDEVINGDSSFSYGTWFKTNQTFTTSSVNVGARLITLFRTDEGQGRQSKLGIGFRGDGTDTLMAFYRDTSGTGFTLLHPNSDFDDDEWHHFAMTYDATIDTLTIFYDGVAVNTASGFQIHDSGTQNLAVGVWDSSNMDGKFIGSMDDFLIFDAALDAPDIAQVIAGTPPNANADSGYSTNEDTALVVPAGTGVLANDTDPNGDSLTATLVAQATSGTVVLSADGSFTYTPDDDFSGTDSFTYRTSDGSLNSPPTTVSITVNAVNDLPAAGNDGTYQALSDKILNVSASNGVLSNDMDVDGDSLTAVLDTTTSNGALVFNGDGSFQYTPNPAYVGSDSFTYHANDGTGNSTTRTVSIEIVDSGAAGSAGSMGDYLITPDGQHVLYVAQSHIAGEGITGHQTLMRMHLESQTVESVDLLGEANGSAVDGTKGKVRLTADNVGRVWASSRYQGSSGHFVPVLIDGDLGLDYGWTDESAFSAGTSLSPAIKIHEELTDFAVHGESITYVDHDTKTVVRHNLSSPDLREELLDVDTFLGTTLGNLGYTTSSTHEFHGFSSDGTYLAFEAIRNDLRELIVVNTLSSEWLSVPSGSTSDHAIAAVSFDRSGNIYWTDMTTSRIKKAEIFPGDTPELGEITTVRQAANSSQVGIADAQAAQLASGLSLDGGTPKARAFDNSFVDTSAFTIHAADLSLNQLSLSTPEGSRKAVKLLQEGMDKVSEKRAAIGGVVSALSRDINSRKGNETILGQSIAGITDADLVREQTTVSRGQVRQASIAELLRQIYQFRGNIHDLLF